MSATQPSAVTAEDLVAAVAADVAGLRRRVGELEQQLVRPAADSDAPEDDQGDDEDTPEFDGVRVWNWSAMDTAETTTARRELATWLRDVLTVRYPAILTHSGWKPCWYRHLDVVEELSWLYAAWRAAYEDPDARPIQAGEWHDKWFPGVMDRIESAMRRCGSGTGTASGGHIERDSYASPLADEGILAWFTDTDTPSPRRDGDGDGDG